MIYRGQVKGGVIVLESPGELPEGSAVNITLVDESERSESPDFMLLMAELAGPTGDPDLAYNVTSDAVARRMEAGMVSGGIPDLALNHDHYLYGHPKVDEDSEGVPVAERDRPLDPSAGVTDDSKATDIDPDDFMLRMLDLAVDTGIPDLGRNHDHYLYGHPKVDDEQ